MEQRETPEGDVHAAGRRIRGTGPDDPTGMPERDRDDDTEADGPDDPDDWAGPATVIQQATAGRNAVMVAGDAHITIRN